MCWDDKCNDEIILSLASVSACACFSAAAAAAAAASGLAKRHKMSGQSSVATQPCCWRISWGCKGAPAVAGVREKNGSAVSVWLTRSKVFCCVKNEGGKISYVLHVVP